jgi:uncharacterized protein
MKTLKNYLFIAVLISLTFPAVCQEDPRAKNGSPTYSNSNLTVIDGLYKAFAVGDIPAVLGAMDSNIVWNEAEGNFYADGNPYIGPEAVLNGVFARIGADHEYFNLKDIVLHEMSNGKVLATLRYDGKHNNGNSYDAQVAHLWSLKDGKVVSFQQYVDTKKLHEAMAK